MRDEKLYGRVITWHEIPEEEVRPGVRRRAYASDAVMVTLNTVVRGMELRPHTHPGMDQLVFITEGECRYHVAGVAHEMGPGSLMLVPGDAEHYIEPVSASCVNIDIFVPPRADYADALAWIESLAQPATSD
jgi:quercetin dioxygenase-like cupin family protein